MPLQDIDKIIRNALEEDAVFEDVTTHALISRKVQAEGKFLAKTDLVLCGLPIVTRIFEIFDSKVKVESKFNEGDKIRKGESLAKVVGSAASILSVERVALNFLQRLSGIATLTRKFVDQLEDTDTKILDTRKTTPGWRRLERYAVKTGGGTNHRFDLKSAIMVKDNHLALVGSLKQALAQVQKVNKDLPVIVEVKNLQELEEALEGGATYVQLDNMGLDPTRKAVQAAAGRCQLEATGGVNLHNIRAIAKTGVDFISIGALTHSAPAVDISLELAWGREGLGL